MDNKEKVQLSAITEVGIFGKLNIEDPTAKDVEPADETNISVEALIDESIQQNKTVTVE